MASMVSLKPKGESITAGAATEGGKAPVRGKLPGRVKAEKQPKRSANVAKVPKSGGFKADKSGFNRAAFQDRQAADEYASGALAEDDPELDEDEPRAGGDPGDESDDDGDNPEREVEEDEEDDDDAGSKAEKQYNELVGLLKAAPPKREAGDDKKPEKQEQEFKLDVEDFTDDEGISEDKARKLPKAIRSSHEHLAKEIVSLKKQLAQLSGPVNRYAQEADSRDVDNFIRKHPEYSGVFGKSPIDSLSPNSPAYKARQEFYAAVQGMDTEKITAMGMKPFDVAKQLLKLTHDKIKHNTQRKRRQADGQKRDSGGRFKKPAARVNRPAPSSGRASGRTPGSSADKAANRSRAARRIAEVFG